MTNLEVLERIGAVDPPSEAALERAHAALQDALHGWRKEVAQTAPVSDSPREGGGSGHIHRSSRREPHRRRGAIAVAAVAIVGAAVCLASIAPGSAPSDAAILKRITRAPLLAQEAGTITTSETVSQRVDSTVTPLAHIISEYAPATGEARQTIRVGAATAGAIPPLTVLATPSWGYVKTLRPSQFLKPWLRYPIGTITDPAQVPEGSIGGLRGATAVVAHLGTRTLDGASITGYEVRISVAALIKEATTRAAQVDYRLDYQDRGVHEFLGTVWLDAGGRVRELSWKIKFPATATTASETSSVTETYSYSSKAITVTVPPASETTTEPNYNTAVGTALDSY